MQKNASAKSTFPLVLKRDGRKIEWDRSRIVRAVRCALASVFSPANWYDLEDFGLSKEHVQLADDVAKFVENRTFGALAEGANPTVEDIQNTVEQTLMGFGEFKAAKSYILYRAERTKARLIADSAKPRQNGLQDYIAIAKYSRYRKDLGRREVWPEPVERVRNMHLRRFAWVDRQPALFSDSGTSFAQEIRQAFKAVADRRVLPSMRSMQFGGLPIEKEEARMFNCAFTFINRVEAFRETLWLLLCGTGTGFSVQRKHIDMLPPFPERGLEETLPVVHFKVEDTIKGWADALDALVRSYLTGHLVEFNYSEIRNKGVPLKTSGGKAPGHVPLRRALENIRKILDKVGGRKMRPIEAYDILMFSARAVLAGGIRRSATICLFSPDDEEMMGAKTGNWFNENQQRSASNNSAVINRNTTPKDVFLRLFEKQKEYGEPGFYFVENEDYGANPCVEIGLAPFADLKEQGDIDRLRELGCETELKIGDRVFGWQMCNLTTINAAACATAEDFYESCKNAAFIGTLQASYAKMPYLGPISQFINERESLLGVSITGILDNPKIMLDPEILRAGAEVVKKENERVASIIGIPAAARTTCVKPEGTASLLLGTSSGIHPHHAKRYFRRVQANRQEPVYQYFHSINPQMTEASVYAPASDDVITFPIQARPGAIVRADVRTLEFLDYIRLVQQNWVCAGRRHEKYNPGLFHNVSNTVVVREGEWDSVANYIWDNRQFFTGVALIPYLGDKVYPQAPNEAVADEADLMRWEALAYNPVDYSKMHEDADNTNLQGEAACAGGHCEVVRT